jgi:SAM-dependent methyltransferase
MNLLKYTTNDVQDNLACKYNLTRPRRRKLLFDDFDLMYEYMGPAVFYPNQNIRRMLDLAKVKENDVFYDLGSGYGQNVIMALTEFNVGKAFGFEQDRERLYISRERLKKIVLRKTGWVYNDDFTDGLSKKRLKEATVIYCGVQDIDVELIHKIESAWSKEEPGRRFVYHHKNVPPELMPDNVAFPFYLSNTQLIKGHISFRHPTKEQEWVEKIVLQPENIVKGPKRSLNQLWKEFSNNYDVEDLKDSVDGIKERLRRVVRKYGKSS